MNIRLSYEEDFTRLILNLKETYGEAMFELEGIGEKQLDLNRNAKAFLNNPTATADVSVDANANVDAKDVIGYQFELPKPLFRLNSMYLLWKQLRQEYPLLPAYADTIIEMQINGDIYINDFSDFGRPYCFNYSCYDIVLEGLPMIKKIKSVAPKHLYSFKSQVEQFIIIASNSTLGATGLADLFICMALYVRKILAKGVDAGFPIGMDDDWEEGVWRYVKETLASLVYTLNQPMRGNQSPFTNVSVYDRNFLGELCPAYVLDGVEADPGIVMTIQEIFLDVMNEELERTPVTFPVTTACFAVKDGEILDHTFKKLIAEKNIKWGFINIYCGATSTLSSCCRLRSEQDQEYFNSFGAGSTKIGSLGVVTLNLPRLAEKASSTQEFMEGLCDLAVDASVINDVKRKILKKRIDEGNMPLYTHGHMALSKQYSTIGVTGLYEALVYLGYDIRSTEGEALAGRILDVLAMCCKTAQEHFGSPHNLEQVPAESSSVKLASKDYLLGFNTWDDWVEPQPPQRYPYYSNQFIPLIAEADMLERIRLQGAFDRKFSGGAICHINLEEQITDPKRIEELIDHCARSGVVYWAVNYNLQRCEDGHMSVGRKDKCACGKPIIENFTRVVGFLTNVNNWNKVRRKEDYPHRQFY